MTHVFSRLARTFLIFLLFFAVTAAPRFAGAQAVAEVAAVEGAAEAPTLTPEQKAALTADPAQVKSVIELLESETARTDFLNKLKAIKSVQDAETVTVVEEKNGKLEGLKAESQGVVARYRQMLDMYDLNETVLGQWLLMCLSTLVYVCALIIVSRAGGWAKERINQTQARYGLDTSRMGRYFRVLGSIFTIIMTCSLLFTWLIIWDVADIGSVQTSVAYVVIAKLLHILLVIVTGVALWEVLNGVIEFYLTRNDTGNIARVRTLLPVARSVSFAIIAVLFALVLLSEMGIDIMPMLAGAGVVGIAVGFGAQTMVKDYISGFTILMEDLIRVGDVAALGGAVGTVEQITLRKVKLRGSDGTVYTVPYSEIMTIENRTKDFNYYLIEQMISYRQDPEEVYALMRKVDEQLRNDPIFGPLMLAPIDIWGMDRVEAGLAVLKARLQTLPGKQFGVGREFNSRLKREILAAGIEVGNPNKMYVVNETLEDDARESAFRAGAASGAEAE